MNFHSQVQPCWSSIWGLFSVWNIHCSYTATIKQKHALCAELDFFFFFKKEEKKHHQVSLSLAQLFLFDSVAVLPCPMAWRALGVHVCGKVTLSTSKPFSASSSCVASKNKGRPQVPKKRDPILSIMVNSVAAHERRPGWVRTGHEDSRCLLGSCLQSVLLLISLCGNTLKWSFHRLKPVINKNKLWAGHSSCLRADELRGDMRKLKKTSYFRNLSFPILSFLFVPPTYMIVSD